MDCDALLDEIGMRTKEVAPLFEINLGSAMTFEQILKKANEALVELTLRSQQQASTLEQQNQQLIKQATTDGLTGLSNRLAFDQFLAEHFRNAIANNKPVSLLLLDVDRFKSINDTYGHQTGDAVLKYLGKLLRTVARAQDLAARYGGEEMALVLPGTTRATAAAIAETLRRVIAARPVACENVSLNVTASIGVASSEPPHLFKEQAQLIKAADLAVYAAKHGGRNCVKVFSPKPPAPGTTSTPAKVEVAA
jgi:diguanylate cyclase (GGDEF)-like protein